MSRYMLEHNVGLIGVHFEKGHYIVTSRFEPIEARGPMTPFKMTLTNSGYSFAESIVLNPNLVTYFERILRKVWFALADEAGEESRIAHVEEIRPVEIHKEHHRDGGDFGCDCGIARVDTRSEIWRVQENV